MRKETLQNLIKAWEETSKSIKKEGDDRKKDKPDEPITMFLGMCMGIDKCTNDLKQLMDLIY